MNKVILMGRLTRDPEVRYSSGQQNDIAIARFSLAVDRRIRGRDGKQEADFFNCTAFGKLGEFVEKYLSQGTKILLTGRIQNNNYTNREGRKVYDVQIIADEIEFAESKSAAEGRGSGTSYAPAPALPEPDEDGFMHIPEGIDEEELPFN